MSSLVEMTLASIMVRTVRMERNGVNIQDIKGITNTTGQKTIPKFLA